MVKVDGGAGRTRARTVGALVAMTFLIAAVGCVGSSPTSGQPGLVTLRIGFGLAAGSSAEHGSVQAARTIALETLARIARDGRTLPRLAESWHESSDDGLTWRIRLHPSVRFHDDKPADAEAIRRIVETQLPETLGAGSAFEDVAEIRALSDRELEFVLRNRSAFLMEQLGDVQISERGPAVSGTGPFYVTSQHGNDIEMRANASYYGGKAAIDRIVIKPYTSVRSAWADMLRRQVDMLYEVGVDALDSLESSSDVKVFTFERAYAYIVLLNVQKPYLRDAAFRRQLNAAIDRTALVADALRGHGTPADGAVWPHHWAYTADLPRFRYDPYVAPSPPRRMTCIFNDPSYERLAIALQKQLQAIGVDLQLELVTGDRFQAQLDTGNFDAFLTDIREGPTMARAYLNWHSGAANNLGRFRSAEVDTALDAIRHAADESTYKAGVAAFERAMVNDPPAIFLAWGERARAVSSRFHVAGDPGTDVLATLRAWRPAGNERGASNN